MDDRRFDSLTKALASGQSRRSVLKGLLGIGGAAAVSTVAVEETGARRRGGITTPPTPARCPDGFDPCPDVDNCCPTGQCAKDGTTCCESGFDACGGLAGELCCPEGTCARDGNVDFCCVGFPGFPCGLDCCVAESRCCGGECCDPDAICMTMVPPGGESSTVEEEVCCFQDNICTYGRITEDFDFAERDCCTDDEECCETDGCCDGECYTPFDLIIATQDGEPFCCPNPDFVCSAAAGETCCPEGTECCPTFDPDLNTRIPVCIDPATQCCGSDVTNCIASQGGEEACWSCEANECIAVPRGDQGDCTQCEGCSGAHECLPNPTVNGTTCLFDPGEENGPEGICCGGDCCDGECIDNVCVFDLRVFKEDDSGQLIDTACFVVHEGPCPPSGTIAASQQCTSDGLTVFANLPGGAYCVEETVEPDGFVGRGPFNVPLTTQDLGIVMVNDPAPTTTTHGPTTTTTAPTTTTTPDPCEGVVCDSPPGECYDPNGACGGGVCIYQPLADGTICGDGCDQCNGAGICVNNTLSGGEACPGGLCCGSGCTQVQCCTNAQCQEGETCDGGTCMTPDPCAGIVCESPPGACFDPNGTCEGGVCIYEPLSSGEVCPGGLCCGSGCAQGVECCTDAQCQEGETCVVGACVGEVCDNFGQPCFPAGINLEDCCEGEYCTSNSGGFCNPCVGFNANCVFDYQCCSGRCLGTFCSPTCDSDADCGGPCVFCNPQAGTAGLCQACSLAGLECVDDVCQR